MAFWLCGWLTRRGWLEYRLEMDGDTLRPEGYKVEEAGIDGDLSVDGIGYAVRANQSLLSTVHRFTIGEVADGILGDAWRDLPNGGKAEFDGTAIGWRGVFDLLELHRLLRNEVQTSFRFSECVFQLCGSGGLQISGSHDQDGHMQAERLRKRSVVDNIADFRREGWRLNLDHFARLIT